MEFPLRDARLFNRRTETLPDLPDFVDVECAFGCNLRCPMCPLGDRAANLPDRPTRIMEPDLFHLVLDQISSRPRILHLNIMGEPLLNPHLPDYVRAAKRRGHYVLFNTNGVRMDDEAARALVAARVDRVCFSLDGFGKATYESIRVGAVRERVFSNVRNFAERNRGRGTTMIKFLVSRKTEGERLRFREYWEPLVDEIEFAPLDDWGGRIALPEELGPRTWRGAEGDRRHPCLLLWNRASVAADGRAILCCHDYRQASALPTVRERPLPSIWNDGVRAFRADHAAGRYGMSPCAECDEWRRMPETIRLLDPGHFSELLKWRAPRIYRALRTAKNAVRRMSGREGSL